MFHKKIVGMYGDCSLPNLGLSASDMNLLTKEVNSLKLLIIMQLLIK